MSMVWPTLGSMTDKEQNRTDGRSMEAQCFVVYRWLRRRWVSGSPQCVVVYRWFHSVLWCTGGWLRRWWVSGSPQCVVVYRWLVEKVVGQWQSTVCCGVQVVEKVVGQWQPADSLQSLAHVACEFMTELSLRSVVCESPHAATDSDDDGERSTCEIVDKVYVPSASYLHVSFDSRLMLLINV